MKRARMAFVLFSAMRNEGPFLFDWIAYHRSIGFDRICIVTNDCTDGSYPLLKKLSEAGVIEHFDQTVPRGVSPQKSAVQLINGKDYLSTGDWAIFLDADEYLNIKVGDGKVSDFAGYLEDRSAQGMLINWRLFGDSGQKIFNGSYVCNDFTRCEVESSYSQFKTFFKVGAGTQGFSPLLHRCLLAPEVNGFSDFLTGSGARLGEVGPPKAIRRHKSWLINGDEPFAYLMGAEIGYDIAQVNHYIVRDPTSFRLKKERGRGYKARSNFNNRHTDRFYGEKNRNEATDRSILRWQAAIEATKVELLKRCDIAQELAVIRRIYRENAYSAGDEVMTAESELKLTQFPLSFPEEEQGFVREIYQGANAIIEYGSGGSTRLAAELGVPCVSVESDSDWSARLNAVLNETYDERSSAVAVHVNIGATKEWGYPQNRRHFDQYWRYPLQVWQDPIADKVDTVLIDGRFRKACFAATLMNIKRETRILFDDYTGRRIYHDVEIFAKPERTVGRMAEFIVKPGLIAPERFTTVIPWFSEVR